MQIAIAPPRTAWLASCAVTLVLLISACAPMPSQLPTTAEVQQSDPLVIDGVWINSINKKRIRISNGRAYAVDGFVTITMVEIKPDEVLIQNLRQESAGEFVGYDLGLKGRWVGLLEPDGTLAVTISTSIGPIRYDLHRQWVDDPEAFDQARGR